MNSDRPDQAPDGAPHEWRDIEAAFDAALEAGDEHQSAILDAHCAQRAELRVEVESLLAAHRRAGGFLIPIARGAGSGDEPVLAAGSLVGAFRLIERIGQGGMGDVYRAERVTGDFAQQVAIKVIAARLQGAGTIERFRAERQILASLQHPNIVTLIDGGVTSAGQPYLVMEYVDGVPITEYCASQRLGLHDRLRIFKQVLAAVAHAHSHLIVHRDLKPANVLVTPNGLVKVLDFGVAKLLESPDRAGAVTEALLAPMTPDYASPEQLRGLPLTTSCDVYSLGVLLYEIVAGTQPYRTAGQDVDEILRTVLEADAPRSSLAASPELPYDARAIKGDIDAIVAMAMAKERARRYNAASELDDELTRVLEARPIVAREPTMAYLLRRTIARHRAAFAIGAISMCLLVGSTIATAWQARVAARERQRALQRYEDVRELTSAIIFKIHDDVKGLPGSTPVRRTVLAEGLKFLERLERDAAADPALRLQLGQGYQRIGDVLGTIGESNLGDRDGAIRSYQRAIDVVSPLLGHDGPTEALQVAGKANLSLARALEGNTSSEAARRALDLATERLRREPQSVNARELLASVHFELALSAGYPSSLPHWEHAKQQFEAILAGDPDSGNKMRNVALVEKYLGGYYERAGDRDRALAHHARAYELDARRASADPQSRHTQIDLSIDLGNLANIHEWRGDLTKAIEMYRQSLEMRQRVSASDPADVYARGRVAYVQARIAVLHMKIGRLDAARIHASEAVRLNKGLVAIALSYRAQQADAYRTLGRIDAAAGSLRGACASFAEAATLYAGLSADRVVAADNREDIDYVTLRLAECRERVP